jgi:glyoxylase-like metal-dependent hydrolase (beta-lactamase superfamily II)
MAQQRDFSKVEIKTTHVAGSVYMLEGAGGNIGASVGPDGILIVDDQFAPLSDKIREALAKIGPGKIKFVLNTHCHGDHTGGNAALGRDGTIVAHENVRVRLSSTQTIHGETIEPVAKEALPVVTFDAGLRIHFNGEEIELVHLPHGHTDGDSVVFFPGSNVVHMGDDFFSGMFPFVDIDSGGDVEGLVKNVQKVLDRVPPGAKIIPGHGSLSTREDLAAFHDVLAATVDFVRKGLTEGKSLEEIQKGPFPEEWKKWGAGFINTETWIETVHRSLKH